MPKIKWLDLPPELLQHLFDRAKERKLTMEDIFALQEWRRHSPDVPEGHWYKDFGSFKLLRTGSVSKDFPFEGSACPWSGKSSRVANYQCICVRWQHYRQIVTAYYGLSNEQRGSPGTMFCPVKAGMAR